jgi:hypothetical protein
MHPTPLLSKGVRLAQELPSEGSIPGYAMLRQSSSGLCRSGQAPSRSYVQLLTHSARQWQAREDSMHRRCLRRSEYGKQRMAPYDPDGCTLAHRWLGSRPGSSLKADYCRGSSIRQGQSRALCHRPVHLPAYCTLGGRISNNSYGAHMVMGGRTVDNVEELEMLTCDGLRIHVGTATSSSRGMGISIRCLGIVATAAFIQPPGQP